MRLSGPLPCCVRKGMLCCWKMVGWVSAIVDGLLLLQVGLLTGHSGVRKKK